MKQEAFSSLISQFGQRDQDVGTNTAAATRRTMLSAKMKMHKGADVNKHPLSQRQQRKTTKNGCWMKQRKSLPLNFPSDTSVNVIF